MLPATVWCVYYTLYCLVYVVENGSYFNSFFFLFQKVRTLFLSLSLSIFLFFSSSGSKWRQCLWLWNGFSPLTCQTNDNTYRMGGMNILENLCVNENDKWNFIRTRAHTHTMCRLYSFESIEFILAIIKSFSMAKQKI